MQVGDASSQMPWEFTPANGRTTQSLDIYRRYARLHLRLFPYAWSYAHSMLSTGWPIVPCMIHLWARVSAKVWNVG